MDTLDKDLKWPCLTYGPVVRVAGPEIKEMEDRAVVAFENRNDAQKAIDSLNGSTFKGRVITVEWCSAPGLQKNSCRHCSKTDSNLIAYKTMGKYVQNAIRVRNCAGKTDRSEIEGLCGTIGPVFCVFEPGLYYEGKGHLGLLVAFENKEDAVKAVDTLNGSLFKGRILKVEWPSTIYQGLG
ncbi:polyadenylate-binding protein 3-like [Papaver somniferum]|uniref:polyadenylate-binding protein 3-like n=1 Tax=Papaver somniferum TaxID=3469 RepID=UPI000E6F5B16|nr:polyadenylate-binding protein 3-like [Papaver somniferum]